MTNRDSKLAMYWAACANDVFLVSELLKRGANANYCHREGVTPLHISAMKNNVEIMQLLLNAHVDVDQCDHDRNTALLFAVDSLSFDSVEFLLRNGAKATCRDKRGYTVLHRAIFSNIKKSVIQTDMLKRMLQTNVDVNAQDSTGKTALTLACIGLDFQHLVYQEHACELVHILLQAEADHSIADRDGKTPLHYAASRHNLKIVQQLIAFECDVNAKDVYGVTPLHVAPKKGNAMNGCMRALLDAGADVNIQNSVGKTALHICVQEYDQESAAMLIAEGANVHLTDISGNTPLHIACGNGLLATVRMLREANADPDLQNDMEDRAIDRAIRGGHAMVVDVLLQHECDTSHVRLDELHFRPHIHAMVLEYRKRLFYTYMASLKRAGIPSMEDTRRDLYAEFIKFK